VTTLTRVFLPLLLLGASLVGEEKSPCSVLVGLVSTEFQYHALNSMRARVELRRCGSESGEALQLLAWRNDRKEPDLSVATNSFGVVQIAARENVFVIEMGGATSDQIFAVVFKNGQPRLVLKHTTRGTATIRINTQEIDIDVPATSVGKVTERAIHESFKLDPNGMKVPNK
jgi:hypothetical protein